MKVIDQTWVAGWGSYVTGEQELRMARWVATGTKELQRMALRFPPHCLVRLAKPLVGLTEADYESTPAPHTFGVVSGYGLRGGFLLVKQHPDDREEVQVDPDKVEMVRPWAGLSRDYVRAVLAMTEASAGAGATKDRNGATRGKTFLLRSRPAWTRWLVRAGATGVYIEGGAVEVGGGVR